LNADQVFVLSYSAQKQDVDIRLASTIVDSSRYDYRSTWNTNTYVGNSQSRLTDVRTGTGTKRGTSHRVLAGLQWAVQSNIHLNIGVVYEQERNEIKTDEPVLASNGSSGNYTSPDYNNRYYYGGAEKKNLRWNFTVDRTTIQIPVMLTWKPAERLEFLFGLNRQIADWTIDEMTFAIFAYREQYDNGVVGITRKENFGERYTQPTERISDVRTTLLAGITVAPSESFRVQLLLTPTQLDLPDGSSKSDYQWWIGLKLYP
jgi:hypothetical protein